MLFVHSLNCVMNSFGVKLYVPVWSAGRSNLRFIVKGPNQDRSVKRKHNCIELSSTRRSKLETKAKTISKAQKQQKKLWKLQKRWFRGNFSWGPLRLHRCRWLTGMYLSLKWMEGPWETRQKEFCFSNKERAQEKELWFKIVDRSATRKRQYVLSSLWNP